MAENLKTSTYNDGAAITFVTDNYAWQTNGTAAYYSYYNNSEILKILMGHYTIGTQLILVNCVHLAGM